MQAIRFDFDSHALVEVLIFSPEKQPFAIESHIKDSGNAALVVIKHLILFLRIAVADNPDVLRLFISAATADYYKRVMQSLDSGKPLTLVSMLSRNQALYMVYSH